MYAPPSDRPPLSSFEERRIGGVTVKIDRHLCVGFETCIEVDPELFVLDDEGIATFAARADRSTREQLIAACESCPVDALVLIDEQGEQLIP